MHTLKHPIEKTHIFYFIQSITGKTFFSVKFSDKAYDRLLSTTD